MKRLLLILISAILMLPALNANAQRKSKSSGKPKTVHVKSYTTKKGRTVTSYHRSRPTRRK